MFGQFVRFLSFRVPTIIIIIWITPLYFLFFILTIPCFSFQIFKSRKFFIRKINRMPSARLIILSNKLWFRKENVVRSEGVCWIVCSINIKSAFIIIIRTSLIHYLKQILFWYLWLYSLNETIENANRIELLRKRIRFTIVALRRMYTTQEQY